MSMEIWLASHRRAALVLPVGLLLAILPAIGCGRRSSAVGGSPDAAADGTMMACAAGGASGASGAGGAGGIWQYTNPVIKGDWSDPGRRARG